MSVFFSETHRKPEKNLPLPSANKVPFKINTVIFSIDDPIKRNKKLFSLAADLSEEQVTFFFFRFQLLLKKEKTLSHVCLSHTKRFFALYVSYSTSQYNNKKNCQESDKLLTMIWISFLISEEFELTAPPYFAEGKKLLGGFLYKRPVFFYSEKGKWVNCPPLFFRKSAERGGS